MQIFWNRDLLFLNLYSRGLWGGVSPSTCKIQSFCFFDQLFLPSPLLVLNIFLLLREVVLQGLSFRDFRVYGSLPGCLGVLNSRCEWRHVPDAWDCVAGEARATGWPCGFWVTLMGPGSSSQGNVLLYLHAGSGIIITSQQWLVFVFVPSWWG